MHFIPTYSSWLNQVERFFSLITGKAIRRGSFKNVRELIRNIDHFVTHHNQSCRPFVSSGALPPIRSSFISVSRLTYPTGR